MPQSGTTDLGATIGSNSSSGVTSLNTLVGDVVLAAGSGVTITPSGNTLTIAAPGGSGTVTSVGFVDSTNLFNVTNSPVTSSGNLTLASFKSQAQNAVFIGPVSGGPGTPSVRLLQAADIPSLSDIYALIDFTNVNADNLTLMAADHVTPQLVLDTSGTIPNPFSLPILSTISNPRVDVNALNSSILILTTDSTINANTGVIGVATGNVVGAVVANSGDILYQTGNVDLTATGSSGGLLFQTGQGPSSGAINFVTGDANSTNSSGDITTATGHTVDGISGQTQISTGSPTGSAGNSGNLNLNTGSAGAVASTGNTGTINLATGTITDSSASGATGIVTITSGANSGVGNSGGVTISTGTAITGTPGQITIIGGNQTDTSATGSGGQIIITGGSAASASSFGANVIITGGLSANPSNSGKVQIGEGNGNGTIVIDPVNGAVITDETGNVGIKVSQTATQRLLIDNAGNTALNWTIRQLLDGSGFKSIDWDGRSAYYNGGTQLAFSWPGLSGTGGLGILDAAGNNILLSSTTTRVLYDVNSNPTIDFNNNILRDSTAFTQQSLNWETRQLSDSSGTTSADWSSAARVSFAKVINLFNAAADPGTASKGDCYFNTTTNKIKVYNGTVWQTVTST